MLSRRRVFAVEPLGGRDGAGKALAHSCIVPGVTSTYRRIPDSADGCTLGLPEGEGEEPRQLLLPKLASWDSGVEMVAGDSPVATFPGLSQDSLSVEPTGSCEPSALAAPEPPGQLGRLLASRKLEQVLERSQARPRLSAQCHALPSAPWSRPGCEIPLLGAGQEPTKAKAEPEVDLEEAEGVTVVPRAWACLPGQGLRYLEHLCLVLEQMARLQQLYLQLQTQRPPEDPEEEEPALVPLPSLSPAPGNGIKGSEELLSPTKETGNPILFLKEQRQQARRLGCSESTLPGCQRPQLNQMTASHPPRDTRIPPTGTSSRSC